MVQLADLNIGKKLGEGGQAQVFLLRDRTGQALKRYRTDQLPALRVDVLKELAAEATRLRIEGELITHWATWPTETVSNGAQVVGFLMPLIPAEFFMTEGNLVGQPASFSYLAATPAPMWGEVSLPEQVERVRLLALLAGILQQLHHRRMVFGDLSWSNVQWTAKPEPRVMLLDCDGIKPPSGAPVSQQLDSPDWEDPEAIPGTPPDQDRDCYKLALMVCRVLTRDLNARPSTAGGHEIRDLPSQLAETIDRLLVQAAGPPGMRPSATEWRQTLQGRVIQQIRRVPKPIPERAFVWPHEAASPSALSAPGARRWRSVTEADQLGAGAPAEKAITARSTAAGSAGAAGSASGAGEGSRPVRGQQENWLWRVLRKARDWADGHPVAPAAAPSADSPNAPEAAEPSTDPLTGGAPDRARARRWNPVGQQDRP